MPTYRAKHRLARSREHPDLASGNSVPWQREYTAVCGYVGYSRDDFIGEHRGVTCLHCQKKMQANKGLQADVGWVCPWCKNSGVLEGNRYGSMPCPHCDHGALPKSAPRS